MRQKEFEFTISEIVQMMINDLVAKGDAKSGERYSTALRLQHNEADHKKSRIYLVLSDPIETEDSK